MRILLLAITFVLTFSYTGNVYGQGFPNPVTLSTGQGPQGSLDPVWLVSGWYPSNPPNPLSATYTQALISNNCAPGSWVNPGSLPYPVNNGNWITNPSYPCSTNTIDGYIYFRLPLTLPPACNGANISTPGSYTLYLTGYVDNTITDVFVNGVSTGINGGGFNAGSQLNMTLTGPWNPGVNYIDVQVYNIPNGGNQNPYGLLLVANTTIGYANGCPPTISGDTIICKGTSTTLWVNESGYNYTWSTGATTDSITVTPLTTTTYRATVTNSGGYVDSTWVTVTVNPLPTPVVNPTATQICNGASTTLTANGGGNYAWNNAASTAAITVSPNTTTTYTVTVTNANTCTATASGTVTVNPLPVPAVNPAAVQICDGKSTTLTATGGGNYVWSNAASTAAITVSPAATTTYKVTVTNTFNCSATASGTVTVNPLPVPAVNPAAVQICTGNSTTLTASGGTNYAWSNAASTAAITVSPAATTTYKVTVTNTFNCSATASGTVTVNPLPVPAVNPAAVQICTGNSTTLTASGGTNYAWSNAASTAAITVSPAATTTYKVTVTNTFNCSATASGTVTVNPLPVPAVNPAAVQICDGKSTTLTATGGGNYLWSNAASTASITVSPNITTTYTVTVTNANTCTATASGTVTVNPLPMPAVNPAAVQICTGNSTTLTASGGTSYVWNNAATTAAITVSPTTTTNYNVTVTDANSCSATTSSTVTVNPLPVPVINPAAIQICTGNSATLTASGGTNYAWSNAATTAAIMVSPVANTTYTVTVTDANSCSAATSSTVTVNPLPVPIVTPASALICQGTGTLLTASGGISYLWSNASTTTAINITPTTTTTYTVTVTDNNLCSASTAATVSVDPYMVLNTIATDVSCFGGNNGAIALTTGNGQQPYSYSWSNAGSTASITGLISGSYTVTVTDHAGCTATSSATVSQPPALLVTSSFSNPTCPTNNYDGSITLTPAGGISPYQYNWSNGAGTENLTSVAPGNYSVTVSDVNNCTVTAAFTLAYLYNFSVKANPTVTINLGDTAQLNYTLTGNAGSYNALWSPGNTLTCDTCAITIASTDLTTLYQIEITNQSGCTASDTVTVIVVPNYSVYIPNAFTPNGDGVNDVFRIFSANKNALAYVQIQIFDRWGEIVFRSNDLDFYWDGRYKGTLVEPGTYVWTLDVSFIDGHALRTQAGSLTLIR